MVLLVPLLLLADTQLQPGCCEQNDSYEQLHFLLSAV